MSNLPMPGHAGRADQLKALENAAEVAGVTLPKAYLTAAQKHRELLARARIAIDSTGDNAADAVIDALLEDRDPIDDARVQAAAARAHVSELRPDIIRRLSGREAALIREHGDSIVKACAKPVSAAYEAINVAAREIPRLDRKAAPALVLQAGATASAAWTGARDAQARLRSLTPFLRLLGRGAVRPDAAQWLHLEPALIGHKAQESEWDAALAGVELVWCGDLATYRQRLATLDELRKAKGADNKAAAIAERQKMSKPLADAWSRAVASSN